MKPFIVTSRHPEVVPVPTPKLTVLNYSGGRQSSALLWMVIRGDISRPKHFVALNADPGMENSETYKYNKIMQKECEQANIELHLKVPGPNLLEDLLELPKRTGLFRIDNPPYWTPPRKAGAKRGQLMQKCTKYYKIAPMDKMVRVILERDFGISRKSTRFGRNVVEKWIGFHNGEMSRVSPPKQKYVYFRYPLIEMGMDDKMIGDYYTKNNLPIPPRSVCNACFANGLNTLKEMHNNRPADWAQAVKVDKVIRHGMKGAMVEEEVFINETCTPLEELAKADFKIGKNKEDQDRLSCDSGYCFV